MKKQTLHRLKNGTTDPEYLDRYAEDVTRECLKLSRDELIEKAVLSDCALTFAWGMDKKPLIPMHKKTLCKAFDLIENHGCTLTGYVMRNSDGKRCLVEKGVTLWQVE